MYKPTDKFSVAIEGQDSVLIDFFIYASLKYFKNATFYDRSERANIARRAEVKIGDSRFASPVSREFARRIQIGLANPPAVAVTVKFIKSGNTSQNVMVIDNQSSRIFTFDLASVRGIFQLEGYASQLVRAIEAAH